VAKGRPRRWSDALKRPLVTWLTPSAIHLAPLHRGAFFQRDQEPSSLHRDILYGRHPCFAPQGTKTRPAPGDVPPGESPWG
jgi:hypothetical protein